MTMRRLSEWRHVCVSPSASIFEAARILQEASTRIVLVIDENSKLLGIVTDGDIRRGLLAGVSAEESCTTVLNTSPQTIGPESRVEELLRLISGGDVNAIPIVSDDRTAHGIWVSHGGHQKLDNTVVIMAGGKGMRLRPITSAIPKPLVSIAGKPMLHHLLESLRGEGFENIAISVNYLGEQIEESVGDGSALGLAVTYLREDAPLGTAGALGFLEPVPESPVLVVNADVVTRARFRDLIDQHGNAAAAITVGMRVHDIEHPFGVLELEGSGVTGIREKPVWREFVSAGVYVLSPEVFSLIPAGQYVDMPDLLTLAINRGLRVEGFPLHESWLDVGTPDDFRKAQESVKDNEK